MLRLFRNYFSGSSLYSKYVSNEVIEEINKVLKLAEAQVQAEFAFTVESRMPLKNIFSMHSARQRAEHLFSVLRIWDTQENNGIFIYILLSERDLEILIDRGIAKYINSEKLEEICLKIRQQIKESVAKNDRMAISNGLSLGVTEFVDKLKIPLSKDSESENQLQEIFKP